MPVPPSDRSSPLNSQSLLVVFALENKHRNRYAAAKSILRSNGTFLGTWSTHAPR